MKGMVIEVSAEREQMVRSLFQLVDNRDVDTLIAAFETDAVQRFGNHPPLRGRHEIRAGNNVFFSSIASIKHEITGLWEVAGTVFIRADVNYTTLDSRIVRLPAMTAFTEGPTGLINDYQIWFDASALVPT